MTTDDEFLALQTKRFEKAVRTIASQLQNLSEVIEGEASRVTQVGTGRRLEFADNYAWIAHEIQRVVLWGVPNLHLDTLTLEAYELDSLRLKPISDQPASG